MSPSIKDASGWGMYGPREASNFYQDILTGQRASRDAQRLQTGLLTGLKLAQGAQEMKQSEDVHLAKMAEHATAMKALEEATKGRQATRQALGNKLTGTLAEVDRRVQKIGADIAKDLAKRLPWGSATLPDGKVNYSRDVRALMDTKKQLEQFQALLPNLPPETAIALLQDAEMGYASMTEGLRIAQVREKIEGLAENGIVEQDQIEGLKTLADDDPDAADAVLDDLRGAFAREQAYNTARDEMAQGAMAMLALPFAKNRRQASAMVQALMLSRHQDLDEWIQQFAGVVTGTSERDYEARKHVSQHMPDADMEEGRGALLGEAPPWWKKSGFTTEEAGLQQVLTLSQDAETKEDFVKAIDRLGIPRSAIREDTELGRAIIANIEAKDQAAWGQPWDVAEPPEEASSPGANYNLSPQGGVKNPGWPQKKSHYDRSPFGVL